MGLGIANSFVTLVINKRVFDFILFNRGIEVLEFFVKKFITESDIYESWQCWVLFPLTVISMSFFDTL